MTKTRKNLFLTILVFMLSLSMAIFAGTASASGSTTVTADKFYAAQSAQVRTVPDENGKMGLGFVSYIDYTLYNNLLDSGATVETGTIIMPEYYVSSEKINAELTLDWVKENGLENKCIVKNTGFINRDQANETTPYFYRGRIDVKEANYTLDFIGCGYITVDGVTYYTYGDDQSKAVVANVKEVALEFAKSDEYFNEIVDEVPAAEEQINAYISAWDFNAKLFDPENDFRRISYGGTKYNYDSVVDASTLGFGGKLYTGKAVKLEGLIHAWEIALAINGAEHYETIMNRGEYDYISMYVALAHKDLENLTTGTSWTGNAIFKGISNLYRTVSISDAKSYNKWFKLSVPISLIADNSMYTLESTVMDLLQAYTLESNWTVDNKDNYTIYIGEITAEKAQDQNMLYDPYGSFGNITSTTTSSGVLLTDEELATISGDYTGGARKVNLSMNTYSSWFYYDPALEEMIKNSNYKYVSLNLAVMSESETTKKFSSGFLSNVFGFGNSISVGPSSLIDNSKAYYLTTNTWVEYIFPVEYLIDRVLDNEETGRVDFLKANSSQSNWSDFWFTFGEVKLLEETSVAEGTTNGTVKRIYDMPTEDDINAPFTDDKYIRSGTTATIDEIKALDGGENVTAAEYNTVGTAKNFLETPYTKNEMWLSKWAYQTDLLNSSYYPNIQGYKYVTIYVAVTSTEEGATLQLGGGLLATANGSTLKFGNTDGAYKFNTWYKVVLTIAQYQKGSFEGTTSYYGLTLHSGTNYYNGEKISSTVGNGVFTLWIGDHAIHKDIPDGYVEGGSTFIAPTANA